MSDRWNWKVNNIWRISLTDFDLLHSSVFAPLTLRRSPGNSYSCNVPPCLLWAMSFEFDSLYNFVHPPRFTLVSSQTLIDTILISMRKSKHPFRILEYKFPRCSASNKYIRADYFESGSSKV